MQVATMQHMSTAFATVAASSAEATAALSVGWSLLGVCFNFLEAPPGTLELAYECARLHRAAVGAYLGATLGQGRDAWRVALTQHGVARSSAVVGVTHTFCASEILPDAHCSSLVLSQALCAEQVNEGSCGPCICGSSASYLAAGIPTMHGLWPTIWLLTP